MKVLLRLMRGAVGLILIFSSGVVAGAEQLGGESACIDRLVGLAKLWAAVKYFHPYLSYRDNIDWGAFIKAITKVDAARTSAEYSAAVEGMLSELGDPVTHVLNVPEPRTGSSSPSTERQPVFQKNAASVLVVTMTNYADFQDFVGTREKLEALKKELPTARAVVFDLHPAVTPSETEQGMASYVISESGLAGELTAVSLDMPAEHTGLFFEATNGTKFIGSPTQGANGDVTNLSVPGGIYVRFSGQGVWHADGRQLQHVGLEPDVEVRPTLAGIRTGKDEVLDKAVEYWQHGPQKQ